MNFWDSSAIVPLFVEEESSQKLISLREECDDISVWALTPVEVVSAVCRRQRLGDIPAEAVVRILRDISGRFRSFQIVADVDRVKELAFRLLRIHPVTAADALQLAAALAACGDHPPSHSFVTLDRVLAEAASKEGFKIFPL